MSRLFENVDETIFEDKDVLSEEYQPDEILERDEEIEQYKHTLKDVLFGRNPTNVMLYGKAGVGKTAVTTYVLQELQEEANNREEAGDVHVHRFNCNGETVFSTVRALINDLLPPGAASFPKRGLSTSDALSEFYSQLDRVGGTHLVVFDEIDHLEDANTLLYDIPRARSKGDLENARIGIIGISNNYKFRDRLSSKVRDALNEDEIAFSTYQSGELRAIVRDRAEKALVDDAFDESALRLAAAIAAKDNGSARQALDLLRKGGEIAGREEDDTITDDHIKEARNEVRRGRLRDKISDQSTHAQLVLEAMAELEDANETPARSKEVMSEYKYVADQREHEPLSTLKSVQNHLNDLTMLGFLTQTQINEGRGGGVYYEYELDMTPEVVSETCDDLFATPL
jgi:cell division control protein 6